MCVAKGVAAQCLTDQVGIAARAQCIVAGRLELREEFLLEQIPAMR